MLEISRKTDNQENVAQKQIINKCKTIVKAGEKFFQFQPLLISQNFSII